MPPAYFFDLGNGYDAERTATLNGRYEKVACEFNSRDAWRKVDGGGLLHVALKNASCMLACVFSFIALQTNVVIYWDDEVRDESGDKILHLPGYWIGTNFGSDAVWGYATVPRTISKCMYAEIIP